MRWCLISWVLCKEQVSRTGTSNYIPHIMWDVITCSCHWWLHLVFSNTRYSKTVTPQPNVMVRYGSFFVVSKFDLCFVLVIAVLHAISYYIILWMAFSYFRQSYAIFLGHGTGDKTLLHGIWQLWTRKGLVTWRGNYWWCNQCGKNYALMHRFTG